ncbi:MAG: radical SAM family heme chaperone HemW [Planctomycetota bacterium]
MLQNTGDLAVLQPNDTLADLPLTPGSVATSLYLHVPFCVHKCGYCDFYSITSQADRQDAWADAIVAEFDALLARVEAAPRTIYVGGGTPTLLEAGTWTGLMQRLAERIDLSPLREFSVEANPETVTPGLLATLRNLGVNRLSIGCQSFQPDLLATLERAHDPATVRSAVAMARDAGIANLSLDLIYAVPGQSLDQLDADLDALLDLAPDHLSCYSLIFEPGTALTAHRDLGRVRPIDNDLEAAMYRRVIDRLHDAGYEHYEVSNWARPDRACEHNLAYWTGGHWLGLGPSAASHIDGLRWKNTPHLGRYLASPGDPPIRDVERLAPDAALGEALMLRLRLRQGVSLDWLDPRVPTGSTRRDTIDRYTATGMMAITEHRLRLTDRGLMVADALLGELL